MIPTVGDDQQVQLLDGRIVRYVNLDHTATTPPMVEVVNAVRAMEKIYGSVHRGSGVKSFLSTWLYEQARRYIAKFFQADLEYHEILFSSNSTAAANKLARVMNLASEDIVLVSEIEHSSNDLPWRKWATLQRYRTHDNHTIDVDSLRQELKKHVSRIKLVAVTGASNVTGYIPPIRDIARLCHEFGKPLFVDCAQLAPHRRVQLSGGDQTERIDMIVVSGHKLGAPYGSAVLIAPRLLFESRQVPSDQPGGGTTDILTDECAYWTSSPDRFESGTPNAIGAVAFAKALHVIEAYGSDNLEAYEAGLWRDALCRLRRIDGVQLYVDDRDGIPRTPIIPFNIEGLPHGLVAAALGFEHGIGVRHGRHCADRLIMRLLGISSAEQSLIVEKVVTHGLKTDIYGVVRPSIGFSNTEEDIVRLYEAVARIASDGPAFDYAPELVNSPVAGRLTSRTGEYWPVGKSLADLLRRNPLSAEFDFLAPKTEV